MKRIVLLLLLIAIPSALAHAEPYQSDPSEGSRLTDAPAAVRVAFTEPVHREGSWIRVFNGTGERVDLGDLRIDGDARPVMTVSLPLNLSEGPYRIAWQTFSTTDGHTVQGSIGFAVGEFAPPKTEVEDAAAIDPLPSLARALLYGGFAMALGPIAFSYTTRTPRPDRLLQCAAGAALLGTLILTWDTWQGTGLRLAPFLGTGGGRGLATRVFLVGGIGVLTVLWTKFKPELRATRPILAVLWLLAAYQAAGLGHVTNVLRLGVWLEFGHLVAASVWIGGLLALFIALRQGPAEWLRLGRAFSKQALASVALLGSTGVVLLVLLVSEVVAQDSSRLWKDSWTWFLIVKIVGFIGMIGAATVNRFGYLATGESSPRWRILRRIAERGGGLRRMVRRELIVAAVVMMSAGLLLSVSPPQPIPEGPPPLEVSAAGAEFEALLQVSPSPTTGASHTLRFYIAEVDSGELVTNNTCGRQDCVSASWISRWDESTRQSAPALPDGDGWWTVDRVIFAQSGPIEVQLDVQTAFVYLDSIVFETFQVHSL